jgi:phosphoribosylanthranilate isomerase
VSLFVKICGLRDAANVAASVEAGANAIGFVFAESVRRVTPRQARDASEMCPANITRVAVMRHPSDEQWQNVLDEFRPDVLQTDAGDFADLDIPENVIRWPVIREGEDVQELPEVFLYEGASSGSGETVDWSRAATIAARGRMILAGGLDADNVARAIAEVRPWGVDVSSAVESAPGLKEPELIRRFIGAVRAAEREL